MIPDPKKAHKKQMEPKCMVNGCFRKTGLVNGICAKCRKRLNSKPSSKKESTREWPKYLKLAKQTFQKLRRIQEADNNGYCKCVDGSYRHWKSCDAGHYIPAKNLATCFDPTNVHPQTKTDNLNMDNPIISNKYTEFMLKKYGQDHINTLTIKSKQVAKFTVTEFKILIDLWENQIKELMIKKGLK